MRLAMPFTTTALVLAAAATATAKDTIRIPEQKPPRVEVVFALDTTGSMGGLLEGAKKKVWSIASEIARAQPRPDVRVGLVAYRDKGDAYVTKITGLTDDLDKIYSELSSFRAEGGGDGPENVRAGLNDALTQIQWCRDEKALRIVFLVGDAPPHLDYQDVPTIDELCQKATKAGIVVNAIRCGPDAETGKIWQEIARKCEGRFFSIDQEGGVVAIATPFDEKLGALNDKLAGTMVAYGDKKTREKAEKREAGAGLMASGSKADRACAKAYAGRYSGDDLVDATRDGKADPAKLKDEELPDELKKLTPDERRAYVEKKAKEREEIKKEIVEQVKKRDAFVAEELKKRGGEKDGFDKCVGEALREQGKRAGLTFKE